MLKNVDRWIHSYVWQSLTKAIRKNHSTRPTHIMFSCMDHYEPEWQGADLSKQYERVERWVKEYPQLAMKHTDADGYHPKHTFFYPAENYVEENMNLLAKICQQGLGEVEIHLHHDNDTEDNLTETLERAKREYSRHGFLGRRSLSGQILFGFIHGNWALNNSRIDGDMCGVNDESRILGNAGCYADFTYPSAPHETQPGKINSIYYTSSRKDKPKTHETGQDAQVGKFRKGDLLMVQGPLTFNWRRRKLGVLPRIENGDITGENPPTKDRVDLWIDQHISVKGKPDWIFVKVYTHGAQEKNADVLLGKEMDEMYSYLESKYNDGKKYVLHYVSAREMYNIIKAAEAGERADPGQYRNYMIEGNVKNEK